MRKYLDIPLSVSVATVSPYRIDALAAQGAVSSVRGERQARPLHCLHRSCLSNGANWSVWLIPILIRASPFGNIIELIQPTFNRSAELNDWVADTLGVLIGIGLGLAYRRVRRHWT